MDLYITDLKLPPAAGQVLLTLGDNVLRLSSEKVLKENKEEEEKA
jgi:hypothetical protein